MFDRPLCMLAFDRPTTLRTLVRTPGTLQVGGPEVLVARCERIVFRAFRHALDSGAVAARCAAMIIDSRRTDLVRAAQDAGYPFGTPVDAGGQKMTGPGPHVTAVRAGLYQGRVRWDPMNAAANAQSAVRLAELSRWLRASDHRFMLELVIEPATEHLDGSALDAETTDPRHRAEATVRAVGQLHAAGVVPGIWRVEGASLREDCAAIAAAVRAHPAAPDAFCVVADRPAAEPVVQRWLSTAAGVPGYGGFALSPDLFRRSLGAWLAGEVDAAEAAEQVAETYAWYVDFYRAAASEACR